MRGPVVSLKRDLVRLKSAKSFEALLVELDHLLRGTGSKARSAGEVLTPFGLLREAVLVEGEENLLLVRTKTPEASRAVAELLPRALQGSPLERYLPFPVGPEPGGEARLSLILDQKHPGAVLAPPPVPGEYAMWWRESETTVFPYTRSVEVWDRWFRTLAGREKEALIALLKLFSLPLDDLDPSADPPENLVLPLALPSGARAVLTYRRDRGPRLHFRKGTPAWEGEALVLNLLRLLQKTFGPGGGARASPALEWWRDLLARSGKSFTTAVGRVVIGRGGET